MGSEQKRKLLIAKIMRTMIDAFINKKQISRAKLEAELCLSEGFTKRKAQEYVNLLLDAERLEQYGEILILSKQEIADRELDKLEVLNGTSKEAIG